jgi:hypothetical protein
MLPMRCLNLVASLLWCALVWAGASADSSAPTAPQEAWTLVSDHWYTLEIAGAKSGWMNQTVHSDGERYRTAEQVHMSIGRGSGAPVEIDMSSSFIESHDGRPISCSVVQGMSRQPMESSWVFHDDRVVRTTRQGSIEKTTDLPLASEPWLPPQAAHRFWKERSEAGAEEITFRTVDPEQGMEPAVITMKLRDRGEFTFDGRTMPVTIWDSSLSLGALSISAVEKMSSDGVLVHQEIRAGFAMSFSLSTQAEAQRAAAAAPDLLAKTFIAPDAPIRNVMGSTKAVYSLRLADGSAMPAIPSSGAQRVDAGSDGLVATVTIDVNARPTAETADTAEWLESSVLVDAADPQVAALARSAVRDAGDDPLARAEALRAAVHRHITLKGLDTAFASASETAKLQRGDCSEHAVLLCAMLRAQSIPARVATGLLYVDDFAGHEDIFGWHMWTQALIDGSWVDFDATLPRRYHAGHILTSVSALGDGAASTDLASIISLMGKLKIDVVDIEHE